MLAQGDVIALVPAEKLAWRSESGVLAQGDAVALVAAEGLAGGQTPGSEVLRHLAQGALDA